jgi:tRNA-(MS[2]IO[6]A)-hydroxylase (MiaE)-like
MADPTGRSFVGSTGTWRHCSGYPAAVPDDAALIDLLGALAYGELTAFDRLAEDARMAPSLSGRAALAQMAATEIGHYRLLAERLTSLGAVAEEAMGPFVAALDGFHAMTVPSDWLEGLVKAYVGDGLAADFYREIADFVDPATRELIIEVLSDTGSAAFAVREVRAAIDAQPALAGRLALWGRRLVGEAISQTQHVLAERDSLTQLLVQGTGDLTGVAALIGRITDKHSERMATLGLDS